MPPLHMLETLISSKTRVKLLLRFFLNSNSTGYLRGLEAELGESSNAIRIELNRFEEAGLLLSFTEGNKKRFQANTGHPLFQEIHNILLKHLGIDQIIEKVINRLGKVDKVYLTGPFAQGMDHAIIDLLLIGDPDRQFLNELVARTEPLVQRKIRYVLYHPDECDGIPWNSFADKPLLLYANYRE